MSLDISNHRERAALRWACTTRLISASSSEAERDQCAKSCPLMHVQDIADVGPTADILKTAVNLVGDPHEIALLVASLVATHGDTVEIEHHRGVQWRIVYYLGGVRMWLAVNYGNGDLVPGIHKRLLALFDATDRAGVLAALRDDHATLGSCQDVPAFGPTRPPPPPPPPGAVAEPSVVGPHGCIRALCERCIKAAIARVEDDDE